jgi:hypothetical protein
MSRPCLHACIFDFEGNALASEVIFWRRLAVFGALDLEEIITRCWIKGTVIDLLFHCFLFIYFGMFGVV